MRCWNRKPLLLEPLKVELDGFLNKLKNLCLGFARRDAARKIRYIRPVAARTLLQYDHITHTNYSFLRPACFSALLSVPGGTSTLGFPATVTVPGFVG